MNDIKRYEKNTDKIPIYRENLYEMQTLNNECHRSKRVR